METPGLLKEFINIFDYIIIDEVHSIICDSTFADASFILQKFMEYAAFMLNKNVIILTATADLLNGYLNQEFGKEKRKWLIRDISNDCIYTVPKSIITVPEKALYEQIIPSLVEKEEKFIYYSNHTKILKKWYNILLGKAKNKDCNGYVSKKKLNESEVAIITSKTSFKKIVSDLPECKDNSELVSQELVENSKLPNGVKVLLSTSRLKEGISIFNEDIHYVFCESHDVSAIIQYMGRVRKSNYILYIVRNAQQFPDKLDKLDYDYCLNKQLSIANEYYKNLNVFAEKEKFIQLIEEKNQYIRFNYITLQFEMFYMRFLMQKNAHFLEMHIHDDEFSPFKWMYDLEPFCIKYNIPVFDYEYKEYLLNSEVINQHVEYIKQNFCDKYLYEKEWQSFLNYIQKNFDIAYKQFEKINKQFENKKILLNIQQNPKKRLGNSKNPIVSYTIKKIKS